MECVDVATSLGFIIVHIPPILLWLLVISKVYLISCPDLPRYSALKIFSSCHYIQFDLNFLYFRSLLESKSIVFIELVALTHFCVMNSDSYHDLLRFSRWNYKYPLKQSTLLSFDSCNCVIGFLFHAVSSLNFHLVHHLVNAFFSWESCSHSLQMDFIVHSSQHQFLDDVLLSRFWDSSM